jgi:hypothetical protein
MRGWTFRLGDAGDGQEVEKRDRPAKQLRAGTLEMRRKLRAGE